MNKENFAFIGNVICQISGDTEVNTFQFPKVENWDSSNLKGFTKQESSLDGVDFEWINQSGDGDWGYQGTLAIEIPMSDGYFIVIKYFD